MILKNYIQFINEMIDKVDISEFNDMELWDLEKAGVSVHNDGTLFINSKTTELNINHTMHENGVLTYDLTEEGHNRLNINASHSKIKILEGIPRVCNSINLDSTYIKNLIDGPEEADDHYSVSNCIYLTSFEGAPRYCHNIHATNTGITDLDGLHSIDQENFSLSANDCIKLTSLEGIPEATIYLNISNCINLESLEHISGDHIEDINIKGCTKLNTLYYLKDSNGDVVGKGGNEGTAISDIELQFYRYYRDEYSGNYYKNLFEFVKEQNIGELHKIYFPDSFIETLSEKEKTMMRSAKGIGKYKL